MPRPKPAGRRQWFFPDGYLPEKNGTPEAHEALMVLNTGSRAAYLDLTLYFEDRSPITGIHLEVEPERIRAFRLDHPEVLGGVKIPPLTQYALRLESDVLVVAQFGRMDTTQANLAYDIGAGFSR